MRFFLCLLVTVCFVATSSADDSHPLSILANPIPSGASQQDVFDSVLDVAPSNGPVLGGPILNEPMLQGSEIVPNQTLRVPPAISLAPGEVPSTLLIPDVACQNGCKPSCCCKQIPQKATFCLVDPRGCKHEARAKVPACCAAESPVVSWKRGVLGRMVATLCWECCDHQVKVIVTRRGKVRVRD